MEEERIYIPLEEYKELLMIKGKYEELKSMYTPYYNTKITYRGDTTDFGLRYPYDVTCCNDENTCECEVA